MMQIRNNYSLLNLFQLNTDLLQELLGKYFKFTKT